ncbi:hypothetical protein GCM10018790_63430 [Kitasatospora xanthocidica]|nr:hypothetical protein GCM10018790_63430 [Kitasatospora xanthocidica]
MYRPAARLADTGYDRHRLRAFIERHRPAPAPSRTDLAPAQRQRAGGWTELWSGEREPRGGLPPAVDSRCCDRLGRLTLGMIGAG